MTSATFYLVDDDPAVREVLRHAVSALGHTVAGTAAHGEAASAAIAACRPDLVVMGLDAAGNGDGIAAAAALREQFDLPVIFLTGPTSAATLQRALKVEPLGFLPRPIDECGLPVILQTALLRRQNELALRQARARAEEQVRVRTAELAARLDGGQPSFTRGSLRAATASRRMESRFRHAVEGAPDAMLMTDATGRILLANPRAAQLFGYTVAELTGQPVHLLLPESLRHAHATATHAYAQAPTRRAMGQGRPLVGRRKDGSELPLEIGLNPIVTDEGMVTLASITDLTERNRTAAALSDREARLSAVHRRLELALRASRTCTWQNEVALNRITLDSSWAEMLGRPPAETVTTARALLTCTHPDDRPALLATLRGAMFGPLDTYTVEHRVTDSNGGWFWIMSQGRVMARDGHGHAVLFVGTNTDVTARKRAEEEVRTLNAHLEHLVLERTADLAAKSAHLARSEQLYRALVETINHGYYVADHRGLFTYCNPAVTAVLGTPAAQLLGTSSFRIVDDADRPRVVAAYRQAAQSGASELTVEFRLASGSGRPMWVEQTTAIVRNVAGELHGFRSVVRDISERRAAEEKLRRSEEKYRAVFDRSPVMIALTGLPEGRVLELNAAAVAGFGFTREEVLGRTTAELGLWVDSADRIRYIQELSTKEHVEGVETWLRRKGGGTFRAVCSGSRIEISGAPVLLHTIEDVTALRLAELEKARLQERMFQHQKFEALGTLAGGVAHDFNNILTGVINYTILARSDCPPTHPHIQEFLDQVLACSDRAKELVRQILLFSRAETGRMETVLVPLVLKEVLTLLRSTLPATATIETDIDRQVPAVLANPTQLHQVILNLGINAAHALQGKPGRILIKLQSVKLDAQAIVALPNLQPGPHVRLEVTDTGCGMDDTVLARIFEPFFTTKPVGEGTGLGLAVAHSVVRNHGGAVNVQSRPGHGSTFEVFLPARPGATRPARTDPVNLPRGRGEHVLLVDDERQAANSAKLLLDRLGYRVSVYNSPELALANFYVDGNGFDVAMLDYQMPGMTGVMLAGCLLAHRPTLPILMASGYAGGITAATLREAGIGRLIHKPFELEELARALRDVLAPQEAAPGPDGPG